ncbi:MAG: glycosyltransferase [Saprospiraceae bacterium]
MANIICTVTNDLSYDQRMTRICTALSEAGHEVVLVGRALSNSPPLQRRPFAQHRFRLFFNTGKLFYAEYNLRLFFYLLFQRFDVVNSVDLDTLLPGFLIASWRGKTCVYDAHEYFTEVPEVTGRPAVKAAWEFLARLLIPRLRHAYTVCDSLALVFGKRYGTAFDVIRNVPIKKTPSHAGHVKNNSPFVLLYQGALNEGRGLEEMIQAMLQLPDCELWLAGEGDLSAQLRQMAMELKLPGQVKFLGRLLPDELAALTPRAHLGLNLLKNIGLNYYYSLANKAFDYIQAGLPSLNMAFPEYRSLHEKSGVFYLVDDLEIPTLVQAVEKLKSNRKLYLSLAAHCTSAAKTLHWDNEKQKLLTFYEQLLSATGK